MSKQPIWQKALHGAGVGIAETGKALLADALQDRRDKAIEEMQRQYGIELENVRSGHEMERTKESAKLQAAAQREHDINTRQDWVIESKQETVPVETIDPVTNQKVTSYKTLTVPYMKFNKRTGERFLLAPEDAAKIMSDGKSFSPKSEKPAFKGNSKSETDAAQTPSLLQPAAPSAPVDTNALPYIAGRGVSRGVNAVGDLTWRVPGMIGGALGRGAYEAVQPVKKAGSEFIQGLLQEEKGY